MGLISPSEHARDAIGSIFFFFYVIGKLCQITSNSGYDESKFETNPPPPQNKKEEDAFARELAVDTVFLIEIQQ